MVRIVFSRNCICKTVAILSACPQAEKRKLDVKKKCLKKLRGIATVPTHVGSSYPIDRAKNKCETSPLKNKSSQIRLFPELSVLENWRLNRCDFSVELPWRLENEG